MSETPPPPPTWRDNLQRVREIADRRYRDLREWFSNASRPKRIAAASSATILAGVTLVGVTGLSDEILALTGEIVFRVDDLPDLAPPDERTTVSDRHGTTIGVLTGPENRISIPLDELPEHMVGAVIATEDQNFWNHEGVSVSGIARAAIKNLVSGGIEQGGSTITQQYVKNALLSQERSFKRKITEATWAVRLEEQMSKEDILQGYLDIVYLGDGTYGVGAASNYWFGKDARDLTVADSALLAGMIRAPEATNPSQEPEIAQRRRDTVVDQMLAEGLITDDQATQAKNTDVGAQLNITPLERPEEKHGFVLEYVKQALLADESFGETRDERGALLFGGGLQITTTLDLGMIAAAEETLAEHLTDPTADPMGGIVSVEPGTGAVRAMAVGPKGFGPCGDQDPCTTTTVNPLAPGMGSPGRQVGSAFKPIVEATALANGARTDWHTIMDSGQSIPGCGDYRPENYDRADGVLDMPAALAESNNVFHVKLGVWTGLEDVVTMAQDLGITNDLGPNCSLALGSAEVHPIEMAAAYATFANHGEYCRPTVIQTILDRRGEEMASLDPDCEQVMDEDVADRVTTMLQGVVRGGTARRADIGRPVAAKTGTTNDNLDAWLVGFTPQLATATWMGYETPEPMTGILGYRSISGGTLPAVMWAQFMSAVHEDLEVLDLPRVDLARYRSPDCPPPPETNDPDGDDPTGPTVDPSTLPTPPGGGNGNGNGGGPSGDGDTTATAWSGAQQEAPDDGSEDTDGYDPITGTWDTGTDGDSFQEGTQPERCNAVAPPEAYGDPAASDEPSESESPSDEPSESETPSDEPTGSETPSDEPTGSESPSEEPTQEPTGSESPSEEPTQEPTASPTPEETATEGT